MTGFKAVAVICAMALTATPLYVEDMEEIEEMEEIEWTEEIGDLDVDSPVEEGELDEDADEGAVEEASSSPSPSVAVGDLYDMLSNIYDSVSGNNVVPSDDVLPDADVPSYYNDYTGSWGLLSSDYYNYFSGFLSKLSPNEHYVCSRYTEWNNNNNYIFAWGEDLSYNGSYFVGTNVHVVTYSNTYSYSLQSSFSFNPNGSFCYSDLSSIYPALSSPSDVYLRLVLYCFAFVFVFYVLTKFVVFRRRSRRSNR